MTDAIGNGPRLPAGSASRGTTTPATGNTAPVTAPAPASVPASQPVGWRQNVGTRVREEVRDQVAREQTIGHDFSADSSDGVSGIASLKLKAQVALPGTEAFTKLVANDGSRSRALEKNPNLVFVRVATPLDVSVSVPIGPGNLGFSAGITASSIMGHDKALVQEGSVAQRAGQLANAVGDRFKTLKIPTNSAELRALNAAPGSEWRVEGRLGAKVGVGYGVDHSVGTDHLGVEAAAGASVSVSADKTYGKTVKHLELPGGGPQLYYVQVDEVASRSASARVGASFTPTVETGVNGVVGNAVDGAINDQLEDEARLSATLSGGLSKSRKVMSQAVLDLQTIEGQKHFDQLMKLNAEDAAGYITANNLTATSETNGRYSSINANIQAGRFNLLDKGHSRASENATVTNQDGSTLASEARFERHIEGGLSRLLGGSEKKFSIRGTTVQLPNGSATAAVEMALSREEKDLTKTEAQELVRFSEAMGSPLAGLNPSSIDEKDTPDGSYAVSLGLTQAHIAKLDTYSREDLVSAFSRAKLDIVERPGGKKPAWLDKTTGALLPNADAIMREYERSLSSMNTDRGRESEKMFAYRDAYGGDLRKDVETYKHIAATVDAMIEARGKPASKWGDALKGVGMMRSEDQRAAMLGLRRLTTGEGQRPAILLGLAVKVDDKVFEARPEGVAAATLQQEVDARMFNPAM